MKSAKRVLLSFVMILAIGSSLSSQADDGPFGVGSGAIPGVGRAEPKTVFYEYDEFLPDGQLVRDIYGEVHRLEYGKRYSESFVARFSSRVKFTKVAVAALVVGAMVTNHDAAQAATVRKKSEEKGPISSVGSNVGATTSFKSFGSSSSASHSASGMH